MTGLWAGQSEFPLPAEQGIFLFSKTSRPAVEPTQLAIQYVSMFFRRIKRPERESDQSPACNPGANNEWSYTLFPPLCLLGMERDNFSFLCPLLCISETESQVRWKMQEHTPDLAKGRKTLNPQLLSEHIVTRCHRLSASAAVQPRRSNASSHSPANTHDVGRYLITRNVSKLERIFPHGRIVFRQQ